MSSRTTSSKQAEATAKVAYLVRRNAKGDSRKTRVSIEGITTLDALREELAEDNLMADGDRFLLQEVHISKRSESKTDLKTILDVCSSSSPVIGLRLTWRQHNTFYIQGEEVPGDSDAEEEQESEQDEEDVRADERSEGRSAVAEEEQRTDSESEDGSIVDAGKQPTRISDIHRVYRRAPEVTQRKSECYEDEQTAVNSNVSGITYFVT